MKTSSEVASMHLKYTHEVQRLAESCMLWWRQVCSRCSIEERESLRLSNEFDVWLTGYKLQHKKSEILRLNLYQMQRFGKGIGRPLIEELFSVSEHLLCGFQSFLEDSRETLKENLDLRPYYFDKIRLDQPYLILQLSHYFPTSDSEIMLPDLGRGDFSLYLTESLPGLECLGEDNVWRRVGVDESSAVIIPGRLVQPTSSSKILGYRFKATEESRKFGYYSMAYLIDTTLSRML